ncbi:hypothetical protein NM208_g8122 [Fusarium decemcellulare]|uniref:Uncharacterized protein n=1 Tax=Fusarium decemcellulare TaxID=57161 RepID=A0ACC1S6N1_9HYPO|nr:hypothetical protein NM208_g8122 [Fusarium decemcellulare]
MKFPSLSPQRLQMPHARSGALLGMAGAPGRRTTTLAVQVGSHTARYTRVVKSIAGAAALLLAMSSTTAGMQWRSQDACGIECAFGYGWCIDSPYLYTCNETGRPTHRMMHRSCEWYCWCGCDESSEVDDNEVFGFEGHAGISLDSM